MQLAPPTHAAPQPPQCALSLAVSTQPTPGQNVEREGSGQTHVPVWHAWSGPQACPQAPQCCESLVVSVHEPLHSVGASGPQRHSPSEQS
jgi:hypothetical protein